MTFRLSFFTTGILLLLLSVMMGITAFFDYGENSHNFSAFLQSSLLFGFLGGLLTIANNHEFSALKLKEGFFLTTMSWFVMGAAGAFPLWMSDIGISYTDALFEGVSAITTTGSTVLSGLDQMSAGVLFWRSFMQWVGGIGVIAFSIVLLPFLRVGGMQLFRTESSDKSEKILPRSSEIIANIVLVYVFLTALCMLSYLVLGMSGFDAVNHALTTVSTGGFSTHDSSFGFFDDASTQLTATFFMLAGGLPFVLYVKAIRQGSLDLFRDEQVITFVAIIAIGTVFLTAWLASSSDKSVFDIFVLVVFNIVSVITTCGYATTDYTLWGGFAIAFFFFLTYFGGCTGSTSGGLKTMRLIIVFKMAKQQLDRLVYPHGVFIERYQGKVIDGEVSASVMSFLFLYVFCNAVVAVLLSLYGLDFETAFSGAATAIANVGPGIGDTIGPAGNFSSLPDGAKLVLTFAMILGRLEIFTVLILFTPYYWRN